MNRTNYSLISALVDSKGGGLYNDMYIPIIKYAIVTLYYDDIGKEYHKTVDVQEVIQKVFGLNIPIVVLKTVIQSLGSLNDISLTIYEKGDSYKITKAWDVSPNETIDEKCKQYEYQFNNIEAEYIKYKEQEGIKDNNTFIDFISANTEEVLCYFENKDLGLLNEKYSILAYFLKHLQTSNKALFNVANELFWGSIIAGFLRRSNVESIHCNPEKIEYFIDTPLVLALLDLSTEERKDYAKEMLDIIKASNGIVRVHPITIKEINTILSGVVDNDPYPLSEIASAYERRKLNRSKIVEIRTKLQRLLEEIGMSIHPNYNDREIDDWIRQYSNNSDVKEIAKKRKSQPHQQIRHIHDVYMSHYARDRREKNHKDCFFVTQNDLLINYFVPKDVHKHPYLLHPSKIVLELWMNSETNSTSSKTPKVLAEAVGRCIIMNDRDVMHKLEVVSHYYNEGSKNFDPEVYKGLMSMLYNRDAEFIRHINEIQENEENGHSGENNKHVLRMIEDVRKRQENSHRRILYMQKQLDKRNFEENILRDKLAEETHKTRAQHKANAHLKKDLIKYEEANRKKDAKIEKLEKRESVRKRLEDVNGKLDKLEDEREKSISYFSFYLRVVIFCIFILIFIASIVVYFIPGLASYRSFILSCGGSTIVIFEILAREFGWSIFDYRIAKHNVREKYIAMWEQQNPDYSNLLKEKEKLQEQYKNLG